MLTRLLDSPAIPHQLIRWGIRIVFSRSLKQQLNKGIERHNTQKRALLRKFSRGPIAHHTDEANLQHYEVPTEFFELVLGSRMKYSCCYWPDNVTSLEQSEEAMLQLTCNRSRIEDGMRILDLGCGWGSLTLWIAEHFPACEVLAVSNSSTQAAYIQQQAQQRGLKGIRTLTANVAELDLDERFDRVISIEMFEHMKNYRALMAKIANWLAPTGFLFVHHFSHKRFAYEFNEQNPNDWMARTFVSGGTMPSDDLLLYFQDDLKVRAHWTLSGMHYARTLRAWWDRLHSQRSEIEELLAEKYGPDSVTKRFHRWAMFFLVTEETWKLHGGEEYVVTHMRFEKSA